MKLFLNIYVLSLIIRHWYKEIQPSCWRLSHGTGKCMWLCAGYSWTARHLRCSSGRWGSSWQTEAFLVVIVVCGILVSPYWCFVFSFLNERPLYLSLFSVEASSCQAFELLQPPGCLFVWTVTMGNKIIQR